MKMGNHRAALHVGTKRKIENVTILTKFSMCQNNMGTVVVPHIEKDAPLSFCPTNGWKVLILKLVDARCWIRTQSRPLV